MVPSVDDLERVAFALGVSVVWTHLPGEAGRWVPGCRTVLIDDRLTDRETICTLAHELGHARHGHVAASAMDRGGAVEREADEYAARLLVDWGEYRAAERAVGPHAVLIADALGLDVPIVEGAQRILARGGVLGR